MKKAAHTPKISDGFSGESVVRLTQTTVERCTYAPIYIEAIGYYPQARFHYFTRQAGEFEYYLMLYCTEGKGYCEVNGHQYTLNSNEMIILPPNVAHSYHSDLDNPYTIYWCHFSGNEAYRLSKHAFRPMSLKVDSFSIRQRRIELLNEVIFILHNDTSHDMLQHANTTFNYILSTFKHIEHIRNLKSQQKQQRSTSEKAIRYMKELIDTALTIDDIAKYCGYSRGRFMVIFKEETGTSPIKYLNALRIEIACQYLKRTDIKTQQLCNKIGISDPLYFSRLFKQYTGVSPTEYRKNNTPENKKIKTSE